MTPERTSPEPAVASAGASPGLTATRPLGSAISVSSPLSTTTAPAARAASPDPAQPPLADLLAGDAEQAPELAGVRRQDGRG